MRILVVEPRRVPCEKDIPSTLAAMQAEVGGTIQAIYPFDEPVALICNDDGKLLGLPLNRALRDGDGSIYDVVAGTFFLCGAPADAEDFVSLTDEEIQKFRKHFWCPEAFIRAGGVILAIPVDESKNETEV